MKRVTKCYLKENTPAPQTLYLPQGAEVVAAAEADGHIALFVITESVPVANELRTFEVHNTDDIINAEKLRHICTYEGATGTKHLLEILMR